MLERGSARRSQQDEAHRAAIDALLARVEAAFMGPAFWQPPMDGLIEPIRAAIHPRRYGPKNRERTNRLLMLMQLQANRQDDVLSPTRGASEPGSRPTAGAPASPAARSPTPAAWPHCAERLERSTRSDGGALVPVR